MPHRDVLADALREHYRLNRELGRGGFATVYLAHDLRHDRPVALKVLHDEIAASLGADRFEREIRFAARLQHPHILGVFDSGALDGRLWFTMPFVEGESLREKLKREGQLPVGDAVGIAREVADALHYAHQHGVMHRDIKPENILLSGRHAMVADFGIARALTDGDGTLTRTGTSIGTPGYMSPEQAAGERNVDERTDVYALACVLYEMLAGEPPFTGPNAQTVIARTLTETPRHIHASRQGVSEALDAVVQRALAKTPADRYSSADAFGEALGASTLTASFAAVTGAGIGAQPAVGAAAGTASGLATGATTGTAAPPPRRRVNVAAIFGLGILLGVGALFAWRKGRPDSGARGVAVLPFENVGATADAYFADGITEEVRGKLTSIPGLRVIARTSSNQYRDSKKSPEDIGGELGADFILTGTVRWADGADGKRHVRVTPELITTSNGATKWQDSFDEVISDVFAMQSAIAQKVAENLGVTLAADVQAQLAERPTTDVTAHREFLLGEVETGSMSRSDGLSYRNGMAHYERAAAIDTAFGLAWARVSQVASEMFSTNPVEELAARAKDALDRAVRYAPDDPMTRRANARYLRLVQKDYAAALVQIDSGLKRWPNDVDLLAGASSLDALLGHWESAVEHAKRAAALDPRNANALSNVARILHGVRRYVEADEYAVKAMALSPANISIMFNRATNFLSMGDLAAAQRVVREGLKVADTTELAAYFALFQETMWVLDPPLQRRITQMTPAQFFNNRQQWALKVGRTWLLLGDTAKGRAYGDTSRIAVEAQLANYPDDAQLHELRGRALALMGRKAEAIAEADQSLKMRETALDATTGPYIKYQVARILVQAGAFDRAMEIIEPLVTTPYADITPAWLQLEPTFRPLRGNPRFERLIGRR